MSQNVDEKIYVIGHKDSRTCFKPNKEVFLMLSYVFIYKNERRDEPLQLHK